MLSAIVAFHGVAFHGVAFHGVAWAQEGTDPDQVGRDKGAQSAFSHRDNARLKAEIDDIQHIRDQLGIDLYEGTSLENPAEKRDASTQFLEVYRRIANRPRPGTPPPLQVERTPTFCFASTADIQLYNSLREAARQLDLAAARRKLSQQPDEAAGLSRMAGEIRTLLSQIMSEHPLREARQPAQSK